MRLRNETITLGLKRKALKPVLYERIDEKNVRIGTRWFKFTKNIIWEPGVLKFSGINGVTIYGEGFKRFIANSWYSDEEIARMEKNLSNSITRIIELKNISH